MTRTSIGGTIGADNEARAKEYAAASPDLLWDSDILYTQRSEVWSVTDVVLTDSGGTISIFKI